MKMLCSVKLSQHKYKTPEGYLYCKDAIIARTGPQTYLKSEIIEGSDSDEYIDVDRSEKEVFSEKTMSSFEGKPLTIEHPSSSVGPENYKELAVGHIQNIRRGEFEGQPVMLADIIVNDAEAIELIESGEMVELSCGYDCDITDGPHPEQINIRGNHLALCEQGRAGIARIVDSAKNSKKEWVTPITDSVGRGTLIQEFGKQGKQYKIAKINGNVIYAESLVDGKTVLFKKDEENIEWATITKSEVKDSENKAGKYYYILAKTRGMFGPASAVLKEQGEELYFVNKADRDAYLQKIKDNESPINNFNSYFPKETEEDFEPGKNTKVIKSLSETSYMKDTKIEDAPIDRSRFKSVEETNELTRKYGSYESAMKHISNEFEEKVKKFPYWVIKSSDWYDPEGLNIPDDSYTIIYGGTEQQCKDKLIGLHEEALNDKEYQDVEKFVNGKSLQIYYPHAIVRAYFTIMKNPEVVKDSCKWQDSFEQFNIFMDKMTLDEAKEYCRVYGLRGKKRPDGFVIFGARTNIENMLNDFVGNEKEIHRILEEGWYSTTDINMNKLFAMDNSPEFAVFVKKDGKWVLFGGSSSGKIDKRAFLEKYEDVKVVENKDLDKVESELNLTKDVQINDEPLTEELAKEIVKEHLEKEWKNNSHQKPSPWGSLNYAKEKLGRELTVDEIDILLSLSRKLYKDILKELMDNTSFEIMVDFRNSFGRDGKHRFSNLDSAYNAAVKYVRECSHSGKSGSAEILIYTTEKDGSLLAADITINSKWSGKRYSNGYAIPVDSDEYDVSKRIHNEKYTEKLLPILESIEPETKTKIGWKDSEPKHFIIGLSGGKDGSTWLGEDDKPTEDFNKAKKFDNYEEADSYRKTYCKGSVQEIRDSKIVDSKLEKSEVEKVKEIISGVKFKEIHYDDEIKVIDIYFPNKVQMKEAGKKLVSLYDIELDDNEGDYVITLYEKFDEPKGIYLTEDSIKDEEGWTGFDLLRGPASKEFKNYLRDRGLYFEPSENGDYVHFEVKNADEYVEQRVEDIRKHWSQFKDSYSKKFYAKAIESLQEKLKKLDKNEILDENNKDYEKQKNKMRKTIEKQIEEYKAKLEND